MITQSETMTAVSGETHTPTITVCYVQVTAREPCQVIREDKGSGARDGRTSGSAKQKCPISIRNGQQKSCAVGQKDYG
jgi:hypothetical protein